MIDKDQGAGSKRSFEDFCKDKNECEINKVDGVISNTNGHYFEMKLLGTEINMQKQSIYERIHK